MDRQTVPLLCPRQCGLPGPAPSVSAQVCFRTLGGMGHTSPAFQHPSGPRVYKQRRKPALPSVPVPGTSDSHTGPLCNTGWLSQTQFSLTRGPPGMSVASPHRLRASSHRTAPDPDARPTAQGVTCASDPPATSQGLPQPLLRSDNLLEQLTEHRETLILAGLLQWILKVTEGQPDDKGGTQAEVWEGSEGRSFCRRQGGARHPPGTWKCSRTWDLPKRHLSGVLRRLCYTGVAAPQLRLWSLPLPVGSGVG